MRVLRLLTLVNFVTGALCASTYATLFLQEWELFKDQFRLKVFAENMQKIAKHNKNYALGLESFQMKMNHFGDLLHHEFVGLMNGFRGTSRNRSTVYEASTFIEPHSSVKIPDSMDWRDHGAVTPVKDQEQCGSCWAFSATGALEGQHFRKAGKLVSLSEQNLVDCSTSFGNDGCNGGLMDNAFQYIKANKGIDTEDSYPYVGMDEACHFKKKDVGADDTGFVDVRRGNENALKAAVATAGPISIAIDASQDSFQFYHNGVYKDKHCSEESLDHGVLAVGYGTNSKGEDYWIVKNSWSEKWGDDGYIYIARNHNNMCGVSSMASYPLV